MEASTPASSSSSWCAQVLLLLAKRRLLAWRTLRATAVEILIPILFLLAFNAPDISMIADNNTAAEVVVPQASTALGLISTFVSSPVFPPLGPFDATYVPAAWAESPALAFAPNSSARARRVMETVKNNILSNSMTPVPLLGFPTEKALVQHYEENPMTMWAGVVFKKPEHQDNATAAAGRSSDESPYPDWRYAIRINGSFAPTTDAEQQFAHRGHLGGAKKNDWIRYYQTGFSLLQFALDQAIIAEVDSTYTYKPPATIKDMASLECFMQASVHNRTPHCNISANVGFRQMPMAEDMTSELLWIFKWLPGWCLNVAAVFFFSAQLVPMVAERRHRSPLELMGLKHTSLQASYLLYGICMAVPTGVLFAFAWRVVRVTTALSSLTLVALFLSSYLVSLTAFAMALAPFLNRGEDRVSQVAFLLCFVLGLAYVGALLAAGNNAGRGSSALKLGLSTFPFGAAHLGGEIIVGLEGNREGMHWSNVSVRGPGGEPSMLELLITIWCSVGVWSLMACYLDQVLPDPEHGDARSACFCVRGICCRSSLSSSLSSSSMSANLLNSQAYYSILPTSDENHEPIAASLRANVSVSVRGLTKVYASSGCMGGGASKTALSGLNVDLVEGQIFSLLGHNGAGKTTAINAITRGNMTSGSVTYKFHSARNGGRLSCSVDDPVDRVTIRTRIGVCPQHDVLWDQCTPREHLRFFAKLKGGGATLSETEKEIDDLLGKINLPKGDNDRPVGLFSGGNKRKVSLAVAMVGNPAVVFLDEPTAGMDPVSRRSVWELLQGFKLGRVIVLTTHFMDEADLLGDRIGIMCEGRVISSGSSLFLKHRFGRGYTLTVTPGTVSDVGAEEKQCGHNAASSSLTKAGAIVTSLVPLARPLKSVDRNGHSVEESWSLPLSSVAVFPRLIQALEVSLFSTSIGQTTLEDVFLEVGKRFAVNQDLLGVDKSNGEKASETNSDKDGVPTAAALLASPSTVIGTKNRHRSGCLPKLCSRTFHSARAICEARLKTLLRSPNALVMQAVIPVMMITMAFASTAMFSKAPYVEPALLRLHGDVLLDEYDNKGEAVSLGNGGVCDAEVVSTDALFISAMRSRNNHQKDVDDPWFGFDSIRTWSSEKIMLENLTAAETSKSRLGLGQSAEGKLSPHHQGDAMTRSCGGIVQNAAIDEVVDASGLAWYSDGAVVLSSNASLVASLPVMLSLYSNTVLLQREEGKVAENDRVDLPGIFAENHPLPYFVPQVVDTAQLFLPMFAGMGFMGIGLGGISLLQDRESRRRHVLHLRGLNPSAYVAGHLMFDLGVVGYPLMLLATALIFVFDVHWLKGAQMVGWLVLATACIFGTAVMGYIGNYLFKTSSMAGRIWPAALPAVTVIPFIVVFVLNSTNASSSMHSPMSSSSSSSSTSKSQLADVISIVFCIVPPFALQEGTSRLIKLAHAGGDNALSDVFQLSLRQGVLLPVILSTIFGVLALCLLLSLERGSEGDRKKGGHGEPALTRSTTSADSMELGTPAVQTPAAASLPASPSAAEGIRVKNLRKTFRIKSDTDSRLITAVRDLSLEVETGELVVLLGPNGAGKTTSMSILATETMATSGSVSIAGRNVTHRSACQALRQEAILGMCPQFDALYEELTVKEHLKLLSTIQNLQNNNSDPTNLGEALARAAGLGQYLGVASRKLSGGNKRKLSLVLALLGSPEVLLLDEPSTGVDVAARRMLWDLLASFRERAAVLLSTHSMEEAVALGDRIAVMVSGSLAASGTRADLQRQYGSGFVLEVSARESCGDRVQEFLQARGATLTERFCDSLKFSIAHSTMHLAEAFEMMNHMVGDDTNASGAMRMVKFYSIAHSTMQDVFMTIVLQEKQKKYDK